MVSKKSVEKQLKRIKFPTGPWVWGQGEVKELPRILLEDEEIYECVNGIYEGGFALLVATDVRVLLIDRKPLNFLTVEDLRFDMINEIDYSHRLLGAQISVSAGSKNLRFTSYNQQRLRKLINHVQHAMANKKKKESDHQTDQNQHLEQINQQLQAYLLAQHKQQEELQEQLKKRAETSSASDDKSPPPITIEPIKPSPELADYLFAQSLMNQHKSASDQPQQASEADEPQERPTIDAPEADVTVTEALPAGKDQAALPLQAPTETGAPPANAQMADLYAEGMREIFGRQKSATEQPSKETTASQTVAANQVVKEATANSSRMPNPVNLALDPLKIAYSKLPMALRNRKFGRPSFHAHSQADSIATHQQPASQSL